MYLHETKCAKIRMILKSSIPNNGYTVYLDNYKNELFSLRISNNERSKYNINDIVELGIYHELTEDDYIESCKILKKVG